MKQHIKPICPSYPLCENASQNEYKTNTEKWQTCVSLLKVKVALLILLCIFSFAVKCKYKGSAQ